jgi:hypothetical protein
LRACALASLQTKRPARARITLKTTLSLLANLLYQLNDEKFVKLVTFQIFFADDRTDPYSALSAGIGLITRFPRFENVPDGLIRWTYSLKSRRFPTGIRRKIIRLRSPIAIARAFRHQPKTDICRLGNVTSRGAIAAR